MEDVLMNAFFGGLMKCKIDLWNYFSGFEKGLWGGSVLLIVSSFLIFDRESYLTLAASVITSSENVCPRFEPAELGINFPG